MVSRGEITFILEDVQVLLDLMCFGVEDFASNLLSKEGHKTCQNLIQVVRDLKSGKKLIFKNWIKLFHKMSISDGRKDDGLKKGHK